MKRRRAGKRVPQWTRLFLHGEPQPGQAWIAVFGIATVGFYLFLIMALPFLL